VGISTLLYTHAPTTENFLHGIFDSAQITTQRN